MTDGRENKKQKERKLEEFRSFEQGPVMITKIHAYLLKEVNLAENAEEKTAEFTNRMCQITLETFWTQELKGQEGFERTDSMLEGLGAGWTASFLAKVYPKVSHYLIKEFLQAVVEVSIVELIALFVTFGAQSFVRGTGAAAHRRDPELAVRWTSDVDCDYPRKLGRINEIDALPGADERESEELGYEEIHGLVE